MVSFVKPVIASSRVCAAYHGNVDAVQQLLDAQPGPNINHQDEVGKYSYPNISNYLKSIFF